MVDSNDINNGINMDELPEDVRQHIDGLTAKLGEFEDKVAESEDKIKQIQAEQEARDKSLKDKMKSEGELRSLLSQQELEIESLKADSDRRQALEKSMRDSVQLRAAEAPAEIQELVKDLPPETALKHLDTILGQTGRGTMPDTGAAYPTGTTGLRRVRLSKEQVDAASVMGMTRDDYRKALHAMENEEIF